MFCALIIMESESASASNNTSFPLFPAYSSCVSNEEVKKDWLCNSSFTESALKEIISQPLSSKQAQTLAEHSVPILSKSELPETHVERKQRDRSHKKRKYEKYQNSSHFVAESESVFSQLRKQTFIEETGLSYERAFQKDSTRDPDNLMYEGFERTKIASYKTHFKIPVGLSANELSWWSEHLPKVKEKISLRYFSKSFLKRMKMINPQEVHSTNELQQNLCLNFIPISESPIYSVEQEEKKLNDSLPNFLNVSSSWKLENKKNEVTMTDKNFETVENELRMKIIYYNKMLSDDPNNIEMWIDFIDFQDKIFLSKNTVQSHTQCSKNLIEKKISIIEKALKHNPKNLNLNILKLKLSQNLQPEKLTLMWDELVFYNPNKPEVWQEYLLHNLSNLTTFKVSNILKMYSKCLETLNNILEGITKSHEPCPDILPNMLEIVSQLCFILKSCGYTEKAIAIYQALIEFNLFCDASMGKLTFNEKLACFEPFWDSGAQRIGEKNALGWAITVQQKKISSDYLSTDSDLNNMEDDILTKNLTVAKTWLEFERLRKIHYWLPWRPNPEYDQTSDDVDDVDRLISFDDVSMFLFQIQEEQYKFLLVMNFLVFLGFDPHFLGCHGISNNVISNHYNLEKFESISYQLEKDNLLHSLINPFPVNTTCWNEERRNFINNIFLQVSDIFSSKHKALCTFMYLKFKQHFVLEVNKRINEKEIRDLKKYVMKILKKSENRNCLLLWCEYICIEWLEDKLSAKKTFEALLKSSIVAISSGNMQQQELWYFAGAFIEFYLNNEKDLSSGILSANEIIWILMHIAKKEKYNPYSGQELKSTMILQTISCFKNDLNNELNTVDETQSMLCYCFDPYTYSFINCAKCFAYFQYFSQGCEAAMQVFENAISSVNSRFIGSLGRYISEHLNITQVEILNYRTWNSTSPIKPLQTLLYNSVKKYPFNSRLLYLLVKLRSASSVINPTRRFLAQILRKSYNNHPMTWFFVLLSEFAVCSSVLIQNNFDEEMLRGIVPNLGIHWRIRSLYEKILQSDNCAYISIFWRSYFKFELMTQNTEKAKSIYHRALQKCGWSKELLLEVIEYFPDELEEILAFLNEKQMRIHTPLEEVTLLRENAIKDS